MSQDKHYLEQELTDLVASDPTIFAFFQMGSLDGIWYWDLENMEAEWMSPEFWRLFGYDPRAKAHLASEWQDMIFQEDLEKALENFKAHLADPDHPYDQIVRYRHRDGSTVWVRCRGIAIRDDSGKPIRMLGAHNDLTELKKSEARFKEQEAKYRKLFTELPMPAYTWKKQGDDFVLSGYNTAALALSQGLIADKQGTLLSDYFEDTPAIIQDIHTCYCDRMNIRKEMRHTLRTTGKTMDTDVNYVFVPPDTVMVLAEDISARKQVEDEIRQLGTAVRQSSSCVVITDHRGNIEYINPRFSQVYGYSLEEAIGKNPRIINSGSQEQKIYQNLWSTITAGQSWSGEFCNVSKTGDKYWVKATISPVTDEHDEIRHFVGVQEDITELKNNQDLLLELATTDSLTKLANRRHFLEKCVQEISRCRRYAGGMALLMVDVDHFKKVNDTLGHDVGDLVLQKLARLMEEALRTSDLAGRLGGEEFGALLPETDLDQAFEVAERLRKLIEKTQITTPSGPIGITVSIGIGGNLAGCQTIEELLKHADLALYEAKAGGRNRVIVHKKN